jgi:phosphoglycolate phosphatase
MEDKIKAVLFDFDGVIVNSLDEIKKIYNIIFDEFNIKENRLIIYQSDFFEADFRVTLKKINISNEKDIIRCVDIYKSIMIEKVLNLPLFYGIKEVIEELSKDYTLAIVTNSTKEIVEAKLKKENLIQYFDYISGIENGIKPDVKPYLHTLKMIKKIPDSSAFIGDMDADMIGAKNSNFKKLIGVSYGFHSEKKLIPYTNIIVKKPQEIISVLKK